MRLRRKQEADVEPVTAVLPPFDPALRSLPDDDPIVEEMVERLRRGLGGLVAVDEWGRPIAWRDVVRVALGTALAELRDARTAVALSTALEDRDAGGPSAEPAGTAAAAEPPALPDAEPAEPALAERREEAPAQAAVAEHLPLPYGPLHAAPEIDLRDERRRPVELGWPSGQ